MNDLSEQLAKHFREIHFGGNWTSSNMHDQLLDVTWQEAATSVHSLNSIAALVYHMNYFVSAVLKVLQGGPLDAHDQYSYDLTPILCREDWEQLRNKALEEAEELALLVEQLPESQLWESFADEKYGSYYRNIHGIIEHTHYHLGQVAVIKKILRETEKASV